MLTGTKATKQTDIQRAWHLFDAQGKILGRLATDIAQILQGKNKPYFVPHLDCGDWVVVVNAGGVQVSGKKEKQKVYYYHSGYPGGLKSVPLERMRKEHPERIIEKAVWGMLPTNKLRDERIRRLRIFKGSEPLDLKQKFIIHK